MPYVDYDGKTMRNMNEAVGKCPICGYEGTQTQFHERNTIRHRGGLQTVVVRIKCPSCGVRLSYKNKGLYIASLLFVFCAFIAVIALMPKYVSLFAYAVGVIALIFYLLDKFRPKKPNKDIFGNDIFVSEEKAEKGSK